MSEAVERYAKEYAEEHAKEYIKEYAKEYAAECVICQKVTFVKNLMKNMKLTMEQALDVLEIQGTEREQIISRLSE